MRNDESLSLLVLHDLVMRKSRRLNKNVNQIHTYWNDTGFLNRELLMLKIKYAKIGKEHRWSSILTDRRLSKLLDAIAKEFEG